MKRVLFTTLSLALLVTACKKADVAVPPAATNNGDQVIGATGPTGSQTPNKGLQASMQTNTVRITDWETMSGWTKTQLDNTQVKMTSSRNFHEMTQSQLDNGAVVVYSKGYNFADASMDKPLELPFYFFLPYERMNLPVYWQYLEKMNGVDMSLKMSSDAVNPFSSAQNNIKFRYFILSPQELARLNKTPREVREMSYEELTTMYKMIP